MTARFRPDSPGARPSFVRARQALSIGLLVASFVAVFTLIDLTPEVERELFFSADDPQLEEDEAIREMFPGPPQILVSVRSDAGFGEAEVARIGELSEELRQIEGVRSTLDMLHGPDDLDEALEHPLWQRLLFSEDGRSTNVVVLLETEEYDRVVPAVDSIVESFRSPDLPIAVSGEPYVIERMRELVVRDFQVFGLGALLVFTLATALLYRSIHITMGAILAAGLATSVTLLVRPLFQLKVDLLTPNITTIVFVLTLLHIIFLTNNWNRADEEDDPVGAAIRWTRPASFWAMLTTGLGFGSLLLTPAAPARNFGISGAVGTVLAFLSAYWIFPAFLESSSPVPSGARFLGKRLAPMFGRLHGRTAIAIFALAALAVPGLTRLNTDPELFEYFQAGSDLREGLERIDRAGGTSPLELGIHDAQGRELATDEAFERMWMLQEALEEDPDVGSVLSLPVLMAEAEEQTIWSFVLSWEFMLERMEDPEHERIAASFVTEDRTFARFLLRMKESARGEQRREEVVARLEATVREHGFEPAMVGGLYALQAKITSLVSSSLVTGLLGLTALFIVIAFIVAPSAGVAAAMILSFSVIPLVLLGVFGYLRIPLDVIALPAANIAMAIGVDDLIHLVHHYRRLSEAGNGSRRPGQTTERVGESWIAARKELLWPIMSSSLIVVVGFGLLLASSFPPTRRLGTAVVLGSLIAMGVVLFAFPPLGASLHRAWLGRGRS